MDDLTVKIVLDQPYTVPDAVASTACIMNEKAVNEAGDNIRQMPVGTGPYKFKQWDSGPRLSWNALMITMMPASDQRPTMWC